MLSEIPGGITKVFANLSPDLKGAVKNRLCFTSVLTEFLSPVITLINEYGDVKQESLLTQLDQCSS
jgi:hypothetical protein